MERKIKALRCIKNGTIYYEKDVIYNVISQDSEDLSVLDKNSNPTTITINGNYIRNNFEIIYEDDLFIPKGWRLLNDELVKSTDKFIHNKLSNRIEDYGKPDLTIGFKANSHTNRYFIRKIDIEYPILTKETAIIGTKVKLNPEGMYYNVNLIRYGDYIFTITAHKTIDIVECSLNNKIIYSGFCYDSLLLVELPNVNRKHKKVTINNCKEGDIVIAGKDFDNNSQYCSKNFFINGEAILSFKNVTSSMIQSNSWELNISESYNELELLLFRDQYEDDISSQTISQMSNNLKTNNIKNGNKVILFPTDPTIRQGKTIKGHSVHGSTRKSSITSRHLSYTASSY